MLDWVLNTLLDGKIYISQIACLYVFYLLENTRVL